MSRDTLHITFRFIILLLLQVLIFNNINFLGYINPHLYLLFIFLYPLEKERINFLLLSFLLGLSIDFFSNSGGINAAATLFVAYIRLPILTILLNKQDLDYKLFKLTGEPILKILVYVATLSFIHHFIVYYLDYFSIQFLKSILFKTIASGFATIFICTLSLIIFAKKKTA
jgi:rod shape-determining protein MreD